MPPQGQLAGTVQKRRISECRSTRGGARAVLGAQRPECDGLVESRQLGDAPAQKPHSPAPPRASAAGRGSLNGGSGEMHSCVIKFLGILDSTCPLCDKFPQRITSGRKARQPYLKKKVPSSSDSCSDVPGASAPGNRR